jgi:hypothetical protein
MNKKISVIAVIAVLAAGLVGCASGSHGAGSRHELYDSLDQLVADSAVVVVVDVGISTETAGTESASAYTSFSTDIVDVLNPAGLGSTLESLTAFDKPVVGGQLTVRQLGTAKIAGPGPMLTTGKEYLLFLIPTEMPGAGSAEYYIVGGTAGAYMQSQDDSYHAISEEEGDKLPVDLRLDDVK